MSLAHVEGAILAGGSSSRMGRDKLTLRWQGVPIIERVARALEACVCPVRVVLRPSTPCPLDLPRIDDAHEERAPIVGIHAALVACESSAVLVAAGDMPEIEPRLLLALLALVPAEAGADVVAPCGPAGPEPLLAVYRPRILPEIERRIEKGELSLRALLESVDTLLIPEAELRCIDPGLASLRNLNRPEDLGRA